MMALFLGVMSFMLFARPLSAQPNGDCGVADCPNNFMPQPVPPGASGRQKIALALAAIATAEANEKNADESLKLQYESIRAELARQYWWLPRPMIGKLITAEKIRTTAAGDREYLHKQEALRKAVAATYKAHNDAIVEVITAYQLIPPIRDFTGDAHAATVNMVDMPWLPHYSRHEIRDKETGQWRRRNEKELAEESRNNLTAGGGAASARTSGNGIMEFYSQAFASPDELAINLFHETSHWVDIAGKSGGFKLSDDPEVSFRTEQHAYERAAAFALQIGANSQRQLNLAVQFKKQADQSNMEHLKWDQVAIRHPDWIGRDRRGLLALTPGDSELSPREENILQENFSEAQRLVERAKEAARSAEEQERFQYELRKQMVEQKEKREWEEALRQSLRPASTPAAVGIPVTSLQSMLTGVKSFAEASCNAPGRVRLTGGITLPFENILFLESDDQAADRLSVGLGNCERLLFRRLIEVIRLGKGRWITDQWVLDTVTFYNTPVTPVQSRTRASAPRERPPAPECSEENGVRGCPK